MFFALDRGGVTHQVFDHVDDGWRRLVSLSPCKAWWQRPSAQTPSEGSMTASRVGRLISHLLDG